MFYHFLLLKLICFELLNSYKRVRFFWEFKFIFSCVRTDVKIQEIDIKNIGKDIGNFQ